MEKEYNRGKEDGERFKSETDEFEVIDKEAFMKSMEEMRDEKELSGSRQEMIDRVRETKEEADHPSFPKGLESYEDSLEKSQTLKESLGKETLKEYDNLDKQRSKLQGKLEELLDKEGSLKTEKEKTKWQEKKESLQQEIKEVSSKIETAESNESFVNAREKGHQVIDEESLSQARLERENLGQEVLDREKILKDKEERIKSILDRHQETSSGPKTLGEIKRWCQDKKRIEQALSDVRDRTESESLVELLGEERTLRWKEIVGSERVEELRQELNEMGEESVEEGESAEEGESIEEAESSSEESAEGDSVEEAAEAGSGGNISGRTETGSQEAKAPLLEAIYKFGASFIYVIYLLIKKGWETARDMVFSAFGAKKEKKDKKEGK